MMWHCKMLMWPCKTGIKKKMTLCSWNENQEHVSPKARRQQGMLWNFWGLTTWSHQMNFSAFRRQHGPVGFSNPKIACMPLVKQVFPSIVDAHKVSVNGLRSSPYCGISIAWRSIFWGSRHFACLTETQLCLILTPNSVPPQLHSQA